MDDFGVYFHVFMYAQQGGTGAQESFVTVFRAFRLSVYKTATGNFRARATRGRSHSGPTKTEPATLSHTLADSGKLDLQKT